MGSLCSHCNKKIYDNYSCRLCKKKFHKNCLFIVKKIDEKLKYIVGDYSSTIIFQAYTQRQFTESKMTDDKKLCRVNFDYECFSCYTKEDTFPYNEWKKKYDMYLAQSRINKDLINFSRKNNRTLSKNFKLSEINSINNNKKYDFL